MKATLKENEEKIVSVSELNNGGAGKIFLDLQKNNSEYIILKNDRPAAVLLSMDKYEKIEAGKGYGRSEYVVRFLSFKSIRQIIIYRSYKMNILTQFKKSEFFLIG